MAAARSRKPVPPTASKPNVVVPQVGLAGLPAAPQFLLRKEYECRICKCRSAIRTSCVVCGNRNCMSEVLVQDVTRGPNVSGEEIARIKRGSLEEAIAKGKKIKRIKSGIPKLDRVLGGGYVDLTSIMIAGDPGAGKSTLLLQACIAYAGPVKKPVEGEEAVRRVLYISAEEEFEQIGARAGRIPGAMEKANYIEFVCTRSVPDAMGAVLDVRPHLTVVDSIQEIGDELLSGEFGGKNQVVNAIQSINDCQRKNGFGTVFYVCHVRKDGDLAGAKKAEHKVDVVCKLSLAQREEEDQDEDTPVEERIVYDERVLEAQKNRYGSVLDSSTFTMTNQGLR